MLANDVSKESNGEGFFAENYQTIVKAQKQIEEVVELLNRDQKKMSKDMKKQRESMDQFLKELQS